MLQMRTILLFVTISLCSYPLTAVAQDWQVDLELYLLGTNIEGDGSIGRHEGVPVGMDFGTILDNLQLGGMMHMEAVRNQRWGIMLDYSFMDLESNLSGPQGGVADINMHQGVLETDFFYRMYAAIGKIDLLTGFRWWDNDVDVSVDTITMPGSVSASLEEDWIDVFVGARWIVPLTEKLNLMLRGDIGGFGLEADFTAQLFGNLRYSFNEHWAADLGYKAVWVDYSTGHRGQPDYFSYDTVTHGPMIGVNYSF